MDARQKRKDDIDTEDDDLEVLDENNILAISNNNRFRPNSNHAVYAHLKQARMIGIKLVIRRISALHLFDHLSGSSSASLGCQLPPPTSYRSDLESGSSKPLFTIRNMLFNIQADFFFQ